MESIVNFLRYVTPATLAFVAVASANYEKTLKLWGQLSANDPTAGTAIILTGTGLVIGIGFIFSTLAYAFVNFLGLRSLGWHEFKDKRFWSSYMRLSGKEWDVAEYKIWQAQNYKKGDREHTTKQIAKRWEMTMANANAIMALVLATAFIIITKIGFTYPLAWWICFSVLFAALVYNTYVGFRSVTNINREP